MLSSTISNQLGPLGPPHSGDQTPRGASIGGTIDVPLPKTGSCIIRVLRKLKKRTHAKHQVYVRADHREQIRVENGPECAGQVLDYWAYQRGVKVRLIDTGRPVQNATIKIFNGWIRDEH